MGERVDRKRRCAWHMMTRVTLKDSEWQRKRKPVKTDNEEKGRRKYGEKGKRSRETDYSLAIGETEIIILIRN